jgi:hypothetical protein
MQAPVLRSLESLRVTRGLPGPVLVVLFRQVMTAAR